MSNAAKVVLGILAITACMFGSGNADVPDTYTLADRAEKQCDQMKRDGVLASWSALSDCYERNVHSIYINANYPNPDLVDQLFVKYRKIHARMDARKVSVREGLLLKKRTLEQINATIGERAVPRFEA